MQWYMTVIPGPREDKVVVSHFKGLLTTQQVQNQSRKKMMGFHVKTNNK